MLITEPLARASLDPVHETQATFRALLDALAWPGSLRQLPVAARRAPGNAWMIAAGLTLLDHETSFAVEPGPESTAVREFLAVRTGARVAAPESADFVLADAACVDPELPLRVRQGDLTYPDVSATLVVSVPRLGGPAGELQVQFAGPGAVSPVMLQLDGLAPEFLEARGEAVQRYPCGCDLFLIDADGRVVGLPRSTRIEDRLSGLHGSQRRLGSDCGGRGARQTRVHRRR